MAEEVNVYEVSLDAYSPAKVAELCAALEIPTAKKTVPINDAKGTLIREEPFLEPVFHTGAGSPEDRFARMVEFFEELQPAVKDKDGKIVRVNSPLDVIGLCVSGRLDLKLRNVITTANKVVDPEAEVQKLAKNLFKAKAGKITMEQAMQRARLALEA